MFQSPGPILIKWGSLTIRWYGVMIALGFLAASFFATRLARRYEIDPEKLVNCFLVSFISGIIGARLYFVALSWGYFSNHPTEIMATWNGGLSIHGGLIGGFLAGYIYCRLNGLPVLKVADIFGIVAGLGQSIGRWGNFFNSEAFGRPVPENFLLKLYIPAQDRPAPYQGAEFFHPTFLYESLWDLTIFTVLYFVLWKHLKDYPGMLFLIYLASYSTGRIFIECLRTDSIMVMGVAVPIVASIVILMFACSGMLVLLLKYRKLQKSQAQNQKK